MIRFLPIIFLLYISLFLACNQDKAPDPDWTLEKIYFHDYESPDHKWGYIDLRGTKSIEAKYDDCHDFSEGLAAVNYKGKWGYIDTVGNAIIPYRYKQVYDFCSGRAFAQNFDDSWTLLDHSGNTVSSVTISQPGHFVLGNCVVAHLGYYGILNQSGHYIVQPKFNSLKIINDTLCIAGDGYKYGVIHINGDTLIPFMYDGITYSTDHQLRLKQKNEYFFIDIRFNGLQSPNYQEASDFNHGTAVVRFANNRLLIDTNYREIANLVYDRIRNGGQGFWVVTKDNRHGLIDSDGKTVIPPIYDGLNKVACNRIAFQQNKLWGYMDQSGKIVLDPFLPICWDYHNDHVRFIGRNGFGILDTNARLVIDDAYKELRDFNNGLARFQTFD